MSGKLKAQRHPLAFGITKWGPLPGTANMWLMWDGPGSGITMYPRDPSVPGVIAGKPIEHPMASGIYYTVREADRAVQALVAAAACQGCGQKVAETEFGGKQLCESCRQRAAAG